MSTRMPMIVSCNASKCSYNSRLYCNAMAVTVGQKGEAVCETFYIGRRKIAFSEPIAFVGACKMELCKFNRHLECEAYSGVSLIDKQGHVICDTFREA